MCRRPPCPGVMLAARSTPNISASCPKVKRNRGANRANKGLTPRTSMSMSPTAPTGMKSSEIKALERMKLLYGDANQMKALPSNARRKASMNRVRLIAQCSFGTPAAAYGPPPPLVNQAPWPNHLFIDSLRSVSAAALSIRSTRSSAHPPALPLVGSGQAEPTLHYSTPRYLSPDGGGDSLSCTKSRAN